MKKKCITAKQMQNQLFRYSKDEKRIDSLFILKSFIMITLISSILFLLKNPNSLNQLNKEFSKIYKSFNNSKELNYNKLSSGKMINKDLSSVDFCRQTCQNRHPKMKNQIIECERVCNKKSKS